MKRAVIHIGMPKCASTFLQYIYLKAAQEQQVTYIGFNPFRPIIQQSMLQASGGKVAVFAEDPGRNVSLPPPADLPLFATNEIFCGIYPLAYRFQSYVLLTPEMMRAYQEIIAGHLKQAFSTYYAGSEAHILMVLCKPESWLGSIYRNLVTMGLSEHPTPYLKSRAELLAQWYNVDFLYDLYAKHFGQDRVHVVSFEMLKENPDAFIAKMDGILDAPVLKDVYARHKTPMNQSLPDNTQEVLRRFFEIVDTVSPPEPGWTNPNSQLKEMLWGYLHNNAMNSPAVIKKLQTLSADLTLDAAVPESVVRAVSANLVKTMSLPDMADYRNMYEAA